jgi:hypothetical protein
MRIRLILATNSDLREKAAIGCGHVDAWVQFPDIATHLSVRCNVQRDSAFCSACCPMGTGVHLQSESCWGLNLIPYNLVTRMKMSVALYFYRMYRDISLSLTLYFDNVFHITVLERGRWSSSYPCHFTASNGHGCQLNGTTSGPMSFSAQF